MSALAAIATYPLDSVITWSSRKMRRTSGVIGIMPAGIVAPRRSRIRSPSVDQNAPSMTLISDLDPEKTTSTTSKRTDRVPQ